MFQNEILFMKTIEWFIFQNEEGFNQIKLPFISFKRLPHARGGTAQKKIINLANWSPLIHSGPASSRPRLCGVESVVRSNADSLLNRAATTSTTGTLNYFTTDLIMANHNNNNPLLKNQVCQIINFPL